MGNLQPATITTWNVVNFQPFLQYPLTQTQPFPRCAQWPLTQTESLVGGKPQQPLVQTQPLSQLQNPGIQTQSGRGGLPTTSTCGGGG